MPHIRCLALIHAATAWYERGHKDYCLATLLQLMQPSTLSTLSEYTVDVLAKEALRLGMLDDVLRMLFFQEQSGKLKRLGLLPELASAYIAAGSVSNSEKTLVLASRVAEKLESLFKRAYARAEIASRQIDLGNWPECIRLVHDALRIAGGPYFRILVILILVQAADRPHGSPSSRELAELREMLMAGFV